MAVCTKGCYRPTHTHRCASRRSPGTVERPTTDTELRALCTQLHLPGRGRVDRGAVRRRGRNGSALEFSSRRSWLTQADKRTLADKARLVTGGLFRKLKCLGEAT